jgi:hypothetical protein
LVHEEVVGPRVAPVVVDRVRAERLVRVSEDRREDLGFVAGVAKYLLRDQGVRGDGARFDDRYELVDRTHRSGLADRADDGVEQTLP